MPRRNSVSMRNKKVVWIHSTVYVTTRLQLCMRLCECQLLSPIGCRLEFHTTSAINVNFREVKPRKIYTLIFWQWFKKLWNLIFVGNWRIMRCLSLCDFVPFCSPFSMIPRSHVVNVGPNLSLNFLSLRLCPAMLRLIVKRAGPIFLR